MEYFFLFIVLLVAALALLILGRLREHRYLKRRLSEVVEPEFLKEITSEEQETQRRQHKFDDSLKKYLS